MLWRVVRVEAKLKVKSSATGLLKHFPILSRVSKEGTLLPRSIRLKKSTEMWSISAKRFFVNMPG
jgi:hypothetical protein